MGNEPRFEDEEDPVIHSPASTSFVAGPGVLGLPERLVVSEAKVPLEPHEIEGTTTGGHVLKHVHSTPKRPRRLQPTRSH